MNTLGWKNQLLTVLIGIGFAALPVASYADSQDEECSQEVLLAYFPGIFVESTLEKFKVPKDQREAIKKELAEKDKNIIKTVETKAAKLTPNPLQDPQQRQVAVKLFRETLLESFSAVMKKHGIKDDKQIQEMLDDIQQQKAKRFAKCMSNQQSQQQQKPAAGSQDEDTDEDDDTNSD